MSRLLIKSSLSWLNNNKETNTTKIAVKEPPKPPSEGKGIKTGIKDNFTQVVSTNPQAKEKIKSFINFKI